MVNTFSYKNDFAYFPVDKLCGDQYWMKTIFNINTLENRMCAALIGDMDWNSLKYVNEIKRKGVPMLTLSGEMDEVTESLSSVDMVVVLTDKTSHDDRLKIVEAVKRSRTPVLMRHSCALNSILGLLKAFSK